MLFLDKCQHRLRIANDGMPALVPQGDVTASCQN
jgi:hypothetical protein